nr:hypothetical protein [Nitrospiraceae bacterium]
MPRTKNGKNHDIPDPGTTKDESVLTSEEESGPTVSRDLAVGFSRLLTPLLLASGDLLALWMALSFSFLLRTRLLGHWFPMPFNQTYPDLLVRIWIPL